MVLTHAIKEDSSDLMVSDKQLCNKLPHGHFLLGGQREFEGASSKKEPIDWTGQVLRQAGSMTFSFLGLVTHNPKSLPAQWPFRDNENSRPDAAQLRKITDGLNNVTQQLQLTGRKVLVLHGVARHPQPQTFDNQ